MSHGCERGCARARREERLDAIGVDHQEKSPMPRLADPEKYTATLVFEIAP